MPELLDEITAPITVELRETEEEIAAMVKSEIPLINDIVDHIALHKGKRLRPIVLLLCSGLSGGISKESIKAAAVIELLHTATLVHDDVVDVSDLRRGGPSVNAVWGNKAAILIGDLFFSRVLSWLAQFNNSEVTEIMSLTIKRVCEGELIQLRNGYRHEVIGEDVYFDLIMGKTATMLAAACEMGAISSSSGNGGGREILKDFGEHLGVAFQIKDDLMDFNGSEKNLGKPVSRDLSENTLTLPILYGLKHSNNGDREKVIAILRRGIEDGDIDVIRRFVVESGGIAYAEETAKQYAGMAQSCLRGYGDSAYRRSLMKLTGFITDRNH